MREARPPHRMSVSDDRTRAALKSFWDQFQSLLEPHGAVAWQGFLDWQAVEPLGDAPAVIIETANPAKFPEEIHKMMTWSPDVPPGMAAALKLPEDFDRMEADYEKFRAYLIQQHTPA